jgi:hypothetical protein
MPADLRVTRLKLERQHRRRGSSTARLPVFSVQYHRRRRRGRNAHPLFSVSEVDAEAPADPERKRAQAKAYGCNSGAQAGGLTAQGAKE